jgi:hypothetical protein
MTSRYVPWLCSAGLLGLVAATLPGFAAGAESDLDRVLARLQRQQDSANAVRIRAEGKRFVPKGGYTEVAPGQDGRVRPPEDETTPLKEDWLLDFRSGRWRIVSESDAFGRRGPWLQVFDGKKVYGSKLDVTFDEAEGVRPNRMGIISGGDHINNFLIGEYPYFLSQGFILTNMNQSFYWHNFKPSLDRENLFVHRQETVRGRPCDIVQTYPAGPKKQEHQYEYAIDREDGSVRRWIYWTWGKKDTEIVIDYRRAGDRMVPTGWTFQRFVVRSDKPWRPVPYKSETLTVTAVDLDPVADDSRFRITVQPGTIVEERHYPNGASVRLDEVKTERVTHYRADESGRLVEGELVNGEFRPHRPWLWWIIGGLALVAVFAAGITYRKVRARRSPAAPPGSPITGGSA